MCVTARKRKALVGWYLCESVRIAITVPYHVDLTHSFARELSIHHIILLKHENDSGHGCATDRDKMRGLDKLPCYIYVPILQWRNIFFIDQHGIECIQLNELIKQQRLSSNVNSTYVPTSTFVM